MKPNSFRLSKQSKQLAGEQIISFIDFESKVLEISKTCMYSMLCLELRYHVSADFEREFYRFLTTDRTLT